MKEECNRDQWKNKQDIPSLKEEEYCAFLERIPMAAYLVKDTPDFELLYGNQVFYHFLGCTKEEMQYRYGYRWGALIDADKLRTLQTAVKEASQEQPAMLEQKIRKADGTDLWFSTKAYPVMVQGENSLLCISCDITKEKTFKNELLEYQETAKAVGARTHNEAFRYNLKDQTAKIYVASTILSGIGTDEQKEYSSFQELIVGKGLIYPEFVDLFYQVFNSVIEKGKSAICELKMKNTEGGFSWIRF